MRTNEAIKCCLDGLQQHVAELVSNDRFTGSAKHEITFEMSLHFGLAITPAHEQQIRAPWCRGISGFVGQNIRRIGKPVHALKSRRTCVDRHVSTKRAFIACGVIGRQMVAFVSFFVLAQLFLVNASFTMLPAMNAMLAGRSARRRMRYGYHCVPNGT